ncbi:MAG: 2-dehydropantoate 2-reductase [Chloroflexi bacterium]|nr:2-dehydropantoate 2-reductase [Chloroflexota bacterium]
MSKIVVVGAGAVGGYYGGLLARGGHDVTFVMRSGLEEVREQGLDVRSPNGDFHVRVGAVASTAEAGVADWVVCSLKATAIDEAERLVRPAVGPETRILALMNGLGIEERFAGWAGAERVFGGMAFVCINRGHGGVIHHLEYGRVSVGHAGDDAAQVAELAALLRSGGVEVVEAPNLRYARWEKLCWNIPFNGLSVASGGLGTESILKDPLLAATGERAMREVVAAANADLEAAGSTARLDPEDVVARMFGQTKMMGDYRTSMVIDYVLGRPLEVEAILGEPSRRAAALGVAVPTVDALYALVRNADRVRRGLQPALRVEDVAGEDSPPPLRRE